MRAGGAAWLVLGVAAVLTGCSALGVTPGPGASASGPVLDPSIPSATPTATVASAPAPTITPVATGDPTSPSDTRTAVVPFITTADWDTGAKALDVSAIVPNVIESGGTCTVQLTSGSTTRTETGPGVAASSYTGCQAVAIDGLASGTWQVRVRYSSEKSAGASAVRTVQVP
ncbi:hypothetical protein [uncultured Amnibacterium sp.]|uniref:hypothetical protein n=1 Tax=uncultured Amnibacterium sp. TaxID=1631851 RepID=UPI0035CA8589